MNENVLFNIGDFPVFQNDFFWILGLFILFGLVYWLYVKYLLPFFNKLEIIEKKKKRRGKYLFLILLILLFLDISISILDLDVLLFSNVALHILIEALIIIIISYWVLWLTRNVFLNHYYRDRERKLDKSRIIESLNEKSLLKTLKWFLATVAILMLMRYIDWDYDLWTFKSPKKGALDIIIWVSSLVTTVLIYILARLLTWVITQFLFFSYYSKNHLDSGLGYSINKLISYFVYFMATIIALKNLGMDMGLLLGGAAALLVGVGLALQGTFSDFFAGLVLLFERPIKVGDFVSFEGRPVKVQKIGLRASKVKSRDSINYIIPNSKMIVHPVINWSHDEKSVRFNITVGVAYGSDTSLVEQILMEAADEHKEILKRPKPKVIFNDFADSSLQFILHYYSTNIYNADWVKSDLRFAIDKKFRENNISIPFPQRDVWMRK